MRPGEPGELADHVTSFTTGRVPEWHPDPRGQAFVEAAIHA